MRYYYFNPFSKQYYFPVGFRKYPIFAKFYQPYKASARLMWKIWQTSSLFRKIFSTTKPEKFLPLEDISNYVTPCSILTFNLGTKGVEQKISILGIERSTNAAFYIKYATSKIACKNVCNEGDVLKQLSHLPFVPKLEMTIFKENEFALIKTTVLEGEKMRYRTIDNQMLKILFTLSDQKIASARNYSSGIRSCFSHGDFCPWNMLVNDGKIELFDWELAGEYPLGYDLFMYIFQFEFLVSEMNRFDYMLEQNADIIQQYFKYFKIEEWIPYLQEFSMLRCKLELEKNNSQLIAPYIKLKEYAEKINTKQEKVIHLVM